MSRPNFRIIEGEQSYEDYDSFKKDYSIVPGGYATEESKNVGPRILARAWASKIKDESPIRIPDRAFRRHL